MSRMDHRTVFRTLAVRLTVVLRTDRVARLVIRIRSVTTGGPHPITSHPTHTNTDPAPWEELLGQIQTRNPVNTINTR